MDEIASREEVKEILIKLKKAMNPLEDHYNFVFKKSTNQFFERYCIFKNEIKNEIEKFSIENYLEGPKEDLDGYPGEVWMFKFNFNNNRIYIKMRNHKHNFLCFRLHVDDGSKECPYKE